MFLGMGPLGIGIDIPPTALRRLRTYYEEEGFRKLKTFCQWVPRLIYLLIMLKIAVGIVGFYKNYFDQVNSVL